MPQDPNDFEQSEEEWPYPDHYVRLSCDNCQMRHATAERSLDKEPFGAWCYECGYSFTRDDIIETGPAVE